MMIAYNEGIIDEKKLASCLNSLRVIEEYTGDVTQYRIAERVVEASQPDFISRSLTEPMLRFSPSSRSTTRPTSSRSACPSRSRPSRPTLPHSLRASRASATRSRSSIRRPSPRPPTSPPPSAPVSPTVWPTSRRVAGRSAGSPTQTKTWIG